MTKPQHPELSPKQRKRLAGKKGASRSSWRFGFGVPLSARDTTHSERTKQYASKHNAALRPRAEGESSLEGAVMQQAED